MLSVCHLVLSLEHGGMENGVVNYSNRIGAHGIRTSIMCIRRKGAMSERLEPDVSVECLGYERGFHFRGVLGLANWIRRSRIRILHTHNPSALKWGGLACLLCPGVRWIHGEHGYAAGGRRPSRLQRWLLRRAAHVTAVSHNLVEETRSQYQRPSLEVEVITNGVDTERFHPASDEEKRRLRDALDIGMDAVVAICVGRLETRKNQALLVRMMSRISDTAGHGQKVVLLLAGDGAERATLEAEAQFSELGDSVRFLGFREDVPELLRASDVLLIPSRWGEGMANVILEANASGLPVLASDIPGNDHLIEDGENGYLLDVDDAEADRAWAETLVRLADDRTEYTRISEASRARMEAEFSMDAMVSRYATMYQNIMTNR